METQEAEASSTAQEGILPEIVIDDTDGALDLSEVLNTKAGFVPLVIPITEPALGGGVAFVPVFIDKPIGGGEGRPNVGAAGYMTTSNGSDALFGAYSGYLLDQKLHVNAGLLDASINLDFYGVGRTGVPEDRELRYTMESTGAMLGGDYQLGESKWRAGLRYLYAEIDTSFDDPISPEFETLFGDPNLTYRMSRVKTTLLYDSRDNIFTPTRGYNMSLSVDANLTEIGGDSNYQEVHWANFWFRPLVDDRVFLGLRGELKQIYGELPDYLQPSVNLRGAPAARYQGKGVATFESELRWQYHPRWSLVGFAGVGMTWQDEDLFEDVADTYTGGAGIRYFIAREYGLHMGLDLAYGEEGAAVYVQFGSAWMRF